MFILFYNKCMSERLVEKRNPEPFLPPLEEWEPVFFDCRGRLCPSLPSPQHAVRYLEFLKHQTLRKPTDLLSHVRRILIARSYRQERVVAEGLQRLFCILKNRGEGLRKHLLALCAPSLDAETLQSLRSEASPPSSDTIVLRSTATKISISEIRGHGTAIALEAMGYLDSGQVEEARSLLENHLKANPADVEATHLLLDIYRRARDHAAFTALRQQLDPVPESVRQLWDEAVTHFGRLA